MAGRGLTRWPNSADKNCPPIPFLVVSFCFETAQALHSEHFATMAKDFGSRRSDFPKESSGFGLMAPPRVAPWRSIRCRCFWPRATRRFNARLFGGLFALREAADRVC